MRDLGGSSPHTPHVAPRPHTHTHTKGTYSGPSGRSNLIRFYMWPVVISVHLSQILPPFASWPPVLSRCTQTPLPPPLPKKPPSSRTLLSPERTLGTEMKACVDSRRRCVVDHLTHARTLNRYPEDETMREINGAHVMMYKGGWVKGTGGFSEVDFASENPSSRHAAASAHPSLSLSSKKTEWARVFPHPSSPTNCNGSAAGERPGAAGTAAERGARDAAMPV